MGVVGHVEARVVDVEGVGVLHHELAAAQQPRARPGLVAELGLDLIEPQRQVLVGRVEVLDEKGEHLLVGRGQQEVVALAVLEPEDVVAVVGPAVGQLVGLLGQQRREVAPLARPSRPSPRARCARRCDRRASRAAATCSRRGRPGGCSRRARASGGSAPRRRPGPREGCAGTGSTSATARLISSMGVGAEDNERFHLRPNGFLAGWAAQASWADGLDSFATQRGEPGEHDRDGQHDATCQHAGPRAVVLGDEAAEQGADRRAKAEREHPPGRVDPAHQRLRRHLLAVGDGVDDHRHVRRTPDDHEEAADDPVARQAW